jgi:hypothetical protein
VRGSLIIAPYRLSLIFISALSTSQTNKRLKGPLILLVGIIVLICLGAIGIKTLQKANKPAETSFYSSLHAALNSNPEFLNKLNVPPQAGWVTLNEKQTAELVEAMLAAHVLDSGRRFNSMLKKKIAQGKLTDVLKVEIMTEENGLRKIRVITQNKSESR